MKAATNLKKPFGTAKFAAVKHARYLAWEDAFDVEFADGLSFLEPQAAVKKANKISTAAEPVTVAVDELGVYFEVRYDTGEVAEVSWAFIRELPPKKGFHSVR